VSPSRRLSHRGIPVTNSLAPLSGAMGVTNVAGFRLDSFQPHRSSAPETRCSSIHDTALDLPKFVQRLSRQYPRVEVELDIGVGARLSNGRDQALDLASGESARAPTDGWNLWSDTRSRSSWNRVLIVRQHVARWAHHLDGVESGKRRRGRGDWIGDHAAAVTDGRGRSSSKRLRVHDRFGAHRRGREQHIRSWLREATP
jgi:DNA-binding transcriptional LysR family regulator